ncbi:putative mannosyl-3-phosphoglycerate synthase [Xylariales sp. PMI_506]|nr:putative mannosyl-3-phosphoglycerate synthase [Xylariales sp. PMI_506]
MRLTSPSRFEQFGSVQIHELQRVLELDSGSASKSPFSLSVSKDALLAAESRMVIVIMCMNEEFKTIEGVLSGIPHDCLIILVSNSDRYPMDRYRVEVQLLQNFCKDADRPAIAIHQKDAGAAKAFEAVGASCLIGDDGLVHNGKGEGMFLGMALAAMTGREYVGFVDADNFIPGSVYEYCKVYAAGLHLAGAPDSMVRVAWSSKPKERNGRFMFDRKGRSSRVVNEWLNSLLQQYSGYGTEIIATGNAGEHAMTISLGMKLQLASGFAVEPYEYIYLFENFSGKLGEKQFDPDSPPVHIHQIETLNPHFHDNKGEEHVQGMRFQALNMLYHSCITPEPIKQSLLGLMENEKVLVHGELPSKERVYPPVGTFDLVCLYDLLCSYAQSFNQITGQPAQELQGIEPIERAGIPRQLSCDGTHTP